MSFAWTELHTNNLNVPSATLAGRTDGPVNSQGDAVAAVVQAGMQALNDHSVNFAIDREKRRQTAFLPTYFTGHRTGGMVAVADIDVEQFGAMSGQRFLQLGLHNGIYARPRHAIGNWLRQPRLNGGRGQVIHRFFWITRTGV